MGGEGSMAGAILSLKKNRALLKKRKIRDLKGILYEKSGKTEIEFKKVGSKELARLKAEIRREARINIRNEIIIYLISVVLLIALIYFICLFISS